MAENEQWPIVKVQFPQERVWAEVDDITSRLELMRDTKGGLNVFNVLCPLVEKGVLTALLLKDYRDLINNHYRSDKSMMDAISANGGIYTGLEIDCLSVDDSVPGVVGGMFEISDPELAMLLKLAA